MSLAVGERVYKRPQLYFPETGAYPGEGLWVIACDYPYQLTLFVLGLYAGGGIISLADAGISGLFPIVCYTVFLAVGVGISRSPLAISASSSFNSLISFS